MNNKVRCWEYNTETGERIIASYPEDNSGYDLVSCLACGQIFSINVAEEVYQGIDRIDAIKGKHCISCGAELEKTIHNYPEKYLSKEGIIHIWKRPLELPEFESKVLEFPDLFR